MCYHALVFCFVFMCLALSVFATIEEHEEEAGVMLYYLEIVIVIWFGVEFCVRLWSAGCRSRFQGWVGRLNFMKSPFCLIDVITIRHSSTAKRSLSHCYPSVPPWLCCPDWVDECTLPPPCVACASSRSCGW